MELVVKHNFSTLKQFSMIAGLHSD